MSAALNICKVLNRVATREETVCWITNAPREGREPHRRVLAFQVVRARRSRLVAARRVLVVEEDEVVFADALKDEAW